jgi:phage terminase small subunit
MAALKNGKHELFAQGLAKGKSQAEAYEDAGYAPSEPNASRLTRNDKVRARVLELQERAAVRAEITVADIARQLDEDRAFARQNGSSAAAVAATMGLAKVLGLIVDKSDIKAQVDASVTIIELVGPEADVEG